MRCTFYLHGLLSCYNVLAREDVCTGGVLMRLYHGSNVIVEKPRLFRSDRRVDFGSGFYVTSSFDQAARWAELVTKRRGQGEPVVSVYELDEERLESLVVRSFDGPTVEWLRFVGENRRGRTPEALDDLVIGPVANDNTMPTLRLFFADVYTEEEAIRRLLPQKLHDQWAFKTQRALDVLGFCGVKHI